MKAGTSEAALGGRQDLFTPVGLATGGYGHWF
jgi:hypothetical protein